ncbi:MAG: hypothetical protein LQ348_003088 [Seirophora lacunosa]|nr:MAG: hypothetical protein LQ344_004454 [Seirophora lacunosa]KAI4192640.1 MAG: hypothetical protein LQ348_003088 [Seirophora lacunosa]
MLSLLATLVFLLSVLSHVHSQSLFQAPAPPASNLSVEPGLEQLAPLFSGLQLNDTSDAQTQCFTNRPGFSVFVPMYRPDCYYLLYTIIIRRSAATPFRWDATQTQLPAVYKYGTCVISIYANGELSREVFTELGAARVAGLVIAHCATPATNLLGGKRQIGISNGYWVAVGGQLPR